MVLVHTGVEDGDHLTAAIPARRPSCRRLDERTALAEHWPKQDVLVDACRQTWQGVQDTERIVVDLEAHVGDRLEPAEYTMMEALKCRDERGTL
jgi:hypothetical protein